MKSGAEVSDRRSALRTRRHDGAPRVAEGFGGVEGLEKREVHRQVQRKVDATTKVLVESKTNGGFPFDSRNCLLVTLNGSS